VARFDVFANPVAAERKHTPYFVDVQNDFISDLQSRVVVPLRREQAFGPRTRDLNPVLHVNDVAVVLDTAALGAVPAGELRKPLGNVHAERGLIQEALDALFGGY
jgi:toxin CcdB